jgi:hypothetical protein
VGPAGKMREETGKCGKDLLCGIFLFLFLILRWLLIQRIGS